MTYELYQNNSFRECVHANIRPDISEYTKYEIKFIVEH